MLEFLQRLIFYEPWASVEVQARGNFRASPGRLHVVYV